MRKAVLCLFWASWTCGVLFLVQFLLSFVFSWLYQNSPIYLSSALLQMIYAFLSYAISFSIIIFIPPALFKMYRKRTPKRQTPESTTPISESKTSVHFSKLKDALGLMEFPTWTDIGLAPVGLIVYLLLASVLTSLFSVFPWFNLSEAQDVGFNSLILASDRIFAFITLVIIAPIMEELIFRGFLYQKIKSFFYQKSVKPTPKQVRKSRQKSDLIAITIATFVTSLAFGIMHGQWNVGINVFALSIVLCILREVTGSIYSGILVHMLKNAIAFYMLYIATIGF